MGAETENQFRSNADCTCSTWNLKNKNIEVKVCTAILPLIQSTTKQIVFEVDPFIEA